MGANSVLVRGGTLIDGTGAPGRTADVVIDDGRITAVGQQGFAAGQVVDVDGAVVCPGFIDLHSHTDFTVASAPGAVSQARQGVTTLVTGNCGYSPFPVVAEHAEELRGMAAFLDDGLSWQWSTAGEYAREVERLDLGVNLALQVGHNALRIAAMGAIDRAPTSEELDRMRTMLRQAALDGAVGLSSGLIYAPGSYAGIDELAALTAEAASAGLLYSTHMRDEGDDLVDAVNEALTVARRSGVRLEISHLKAAGEPNWGRVTEALALIDRARHTGVDVAADQYPYTASSTTLTTWLPGWAMDGGTAALVERLDDPATSARIVEEIGPRRSVDRAVRPDQIVLADTPDGPYAGLVGESLATAARRLGLDAAHALVELLRGQRGRIGVVNHSMAEADVRTVMQHPLVSVASDSHTPGCPGRGRPHPRGLGTFARVLGRYARDEGVLTVSEAVRKLTSLPASRLGWTDRGVLRPGSVADITVFDPAAVIDNATYTEPWQLASGVLHTFVSGTPVLADGELTGSTPGRVLRR